MNAELPNTMEGLIRAIKLNNWRIEYTTAGHIKVYDNRDRWVTTAAKTHSDWRGVKNFRAALKRGGLRALPEPTAKAVPPPQPTIEYFDANNPKSEPTPPQEPVMSPPKIKPLERGKLKQIILEAIQVAGNPEDGFSPKEVFDLVSVDLPGMTVERIGVALSAYSARGAVSRVGKGRYRLPLSTPLHPPQAPVAPVPVDSATIANDDPELDVVMIDGMIEKLERALEQARAVRAAVARYGKLSKKYAALKAALDQLKE